ncbi:MAG: hypothetical protein IJM36_01035 [Acholeplasmatales bacterium]|nr:hypothetical protein [Acholeplasmatales bacterium]
MIVSPNLALSWLKEGNEAYINSEKNHLGDISLEKRLHTHKHGQNPYAVIVTCSDSRVIPESIFMAGIGDLFVIRLAGNVVADFGMGSIEYAIDHLNCKLIVVMGHTMCGAIHSAIEDSHSNYISSIIKEIQFAIKGEKDNTNAAKINVLNTINKIKSSEIIKEKLKDDLKIVGAMYHTHSGHVEFYK